MFKLLGGEDEVTKNYARKNIPVTKLVNNTGNTKTGLKKKGTFLGCSNLNT